jgi:asparagine synthase (glutamine-hydrolysing)
MCGIAGIWKRDGDTLNRETLVRFTDSLQHRGPNGSGYEVFDSCLGLGHRRLSILDISLKAAQPMTVQGTGLHISYNGEVFNFLELKDELNGLGHNFNTESDTEVILAAYAEWGMDAFHKFNCMWAMAIWNESTQELLLCRDRFGIKPLYYWADEGLLAWASETKAFDHLDDFQLDIDEQLLHLCMADPYALEGKGHTIYSGLKQLLPGHYIRIRGNERAEQKRWYNILHSTIAVPETYEDQVEQFRLLFKEACKLRMRSDVTLATALSGGVDSTAVYSMIHSIMQEGTPHRSPEDWQRAFVAVFPGTDKDERPYAEQAVAHTGGQALYVEQNLSSLPERIIRSTHAFHSVSSTPILALTGVYEAMNEAGVTVSLDGHGVDEMLYGYRDMVYKGMDFHKWHGKKEDTLGTMEVLLGMYAPEQREEKRVALLNDIESAFMQRGSFSHKVKQLFSSDRGKLERGITDMIPSMSRDAYDFSHMDAFDHMVHQEFFIRTLPSLLRNYDLASMMNSVEIRMPFMDYRLVELVFSLPYSSKLGGGYTKRILRDAMKEIMPESIRTRTFKVGLAAPTKDWFGGALKEFLGDELESSGFRDNALLEAKELDQMKSLQASGQWTDQEASRMWIALNAHLIRKGR